MKEIKEEINDSDYDLMMKELVESKKFEDDNYSVFIFGQGGQTRSFYYNLKQNNDVELIWTGFSGGKLLLPISFIPGQAGFLKVKNILMVKQLYDEVGAMSMCGLYYFRKEKEIEIINEVKKNKLNCNLDEILKNEDEYFLLDIDFDYNGNKKGNELLFRIIRYSENLNSQLKEILKLN